MEALEKSKEKRVKSGGPHGTKSKSSATVDPPPAPPTHQHVRLRIKLPVSPARNLAGSAATKGAKSTAPVAPVTAIHEPTASDLSDHKSSDSEPASPVPEYQDFSNTTLKELRRRYEAKFGTVTLSNNSDYLKRKLAGQCGPPRLRRSNADHDVPIDRSPKRSPRRSPAFRRRKDALETDPREVESEVELELEVEDADGEDEDSDPDGGMQDGDASTPLKKQRSGRKDGGANQWTNQAEEIRRIVRKKRRNRAFPPQTLVWAKLDGRPWWPARVVFPDDVPESVAEKKLVGWTCVELYGLSPTDELRFAWLKRENLASYNKFRKDFNEQKFPEQLEDGTFQSALKEISDEAKRRRSVEHAAGTKLFREDRGSSMEPRSSNSTSSGEDASEAAAAAALRKEAIDTGKKHLKHRAEIVQGKLKQIRMKKVNGLQLDDPKPARPVWPVEEHQNLFKFKKAKDNGGDMNRKRKRLAVDEHQKDDSQGTSDEADDLLPLPDSPPKKAVSDSKFNRPTFGKKLSRSLSNAGDSVKVDKDGPRKPKRTGEDGYYYDCEVCGIGGELLCCDLCPRVYHLECLTPPLKRTPPGKWVCPTCRDRSGVMRSAGTSLADARQQAKVKSVEDSSTRAGHKIWRKEKPLGAPVISADKLSKRKREDSDSKRRRKRSKSKGEEDGHRRLNCGYCGVETHSLRSSGLCDKCHAEIRAGTVDDHPSNSGAAESVEPTQHEKDKQTTKGCHTCGEPGAAISCENCSRAFHKDCVAPSLRKTLKSPWFCSSCSSGGDYKLGDEHPFDALSAEVHRILGCRVVGGQGSLPTEKEKDEQLMDETPNLKEGDANGILEGPGDPDKEWKVVKRKQASDASPIRGAVPMEIDESLSGAGSTKSPNSKISEPETKAVLSETESTPDKTPAPAQKEKATINDTIQVIEDPSFVIEIGGHAMNLNVRLPLEGNVGEVRGDPAAADAEAPETKGGMKYPSLEFLVKWRGRSHIHNDWVSEERLRVIARRKLEEYKAKHGTASLVIMDEQWVQPQRILARRVSTSGVSEVLVKWHSLPYDDCTWEEEKHPAIAKNLELLERFAGNKANVISSRPAAIEELLEQPEWLRGGGVLFPHQLEALNWLRRSWLRRKHVILADEMGLGKTISACAFLASLYREFHVSTPCLVVVPSSAMSKWLSELSVWAPFLNLIEYHGSLKARALIREYEWYGQTEEEVKFNVMLASHEVVVADSSHLRVVPWEVVVVDESHRQKNSLLPALKSELRVLLTDSALESDVREMCKALSFLQPKVFPSQGAVEEKFGGDAQELKKVLAPHMLRRLKKDAMQTVAPIAERVVPVELTPVQAEHYRGVLTKHYHLLRSQNRSLVDVMMQLRIVCNHPYLLPGLAPEGGSPRSLHEMRIKASAKLTLLHSMLHHLKKGGHRVLIFSQMTKLLDILGEYLSFEFGNHSFERVDESVPVMERQKAVSRFNEDQSRFVFLLSTRSCGLGINLSSADTVVVHDSDIDPLADIQALNRAHQIGQAKTLLVYRLVVRASVEERILQLARKNLSAKKPSFQKEVEDIVQWGTEELFAEDASEGDTLVVLDAENIAAEEVRKSENSSRLNSEVNDTSEGGKSQRKVKAGTVFWDDAAITRLLDRSELATSNLEVAKWDQEGDWLGSLKTWTWNEPDGMEQVDSGESAKKDIDAAENPPNATEERQNKWEELLRARWEKLPKVEEAVRGREKSARKDGFSNESKSMEDSSDHTEEELDGDRSSEPSASRVTLTQLLGKVRADDQASNLADDVQLSLGKPFKTPASTSSIPLSQAAIKDEERRPNLQSVHSNGSAKSQLPITIDLEGAPPRATPSINIINVEKSRNGNVSYPHRVYTVPGTPMEPSLASSKHVAPSLISREQVDTDLSMLRKQLDRGSQSSLSSHAIRHLLSPAIQGSSVGQFGLANIRPISFDNEPERVVASLGNRRHEPELPGLQPDLLQRAFTRESQNAAKLSTSGLPDIPHASSVPDVRDVPGGSLNMSEILRRVANKKGGGIMLPPALTDGRTSSQLLPPDPLPNVPTPNLSISLGLGGLKLTSQDQALLVRALASRDSQNKMGSSLGGHSSSSVVGTDATRVHVGETLPLPSDGTSRLFSGSQDMVGLQSVHKHEMGRKTSPDARFKHAPHVEPWTEDELDSLWTGVRRMGVGNWLAMLADRRLIFHKSRTAHDLAERWREEQARLFGAPPAEPDSSRPTRQGYSPLSSGEDALPPRYSSEEPTQTKKRKDPEPFFPKDTIDLTNTASFGEFDRKQVLESLRAVDLSYRRSSGLTGNPAIDKVEYSKVLESSSALDLVRSQTHTMEWDGSATRRKEILRQSHLQKTKLPASFLANLSFNQTEKHEHHTTLPLLPQVPLLGQSSKTPFGESFSRGASLSSTFADLDKRRLKMGGGPNEANPSLPHWLREAFKPDHHHAAPPPPPPAPKPATVSPMITAVAQATSFLYKDCAPFLPPFVHPGPLPPPPRRAKRHRRPELNNFLTEATIPSLSSSLQQFASSLNQQPASVKRVVDFSALPTLDAPRPSPETLRSLLALPPHQERGRKEEAPPTSTTRKLSSSPESMQESKLPSWMMMAGANRGSSKHEEEDGQSSSETESDPRVRGAAGLTGDDSDASSDETVSDDRTQ